MNQLKEKALRQKQAENAKTKIRGLNPKVGTKAPFSVINETWEGSSRPFDLQSRYQHDIE